MNARRRLEIGLEPYAVKKDIISEAPRQFFIASSRGVDRADAAANFARDGKIDDSVAQLAFPYRMARRIEIFHGEEAGPRVMSKHRRSRVRHGGTCQP